MSIAYGTQLCRDLQDAGAPGLHFYTLNLEKVRTEMFVFECVLT